MSATSPITWVDGQLVNFTLLNIELRDALNDFRDATGMIRLSKIPITVRSYVLSSSTGVLGNLGSIGTIALPAIPVASRVLIDAGGMIGFAGSASGFGLNITASAGTLTNAQGNQRTWCATTAKWYSYANAAYLDLPANTASTLTVTLSTDGANGYWRGQVTCGVLLPGEY
jgi:hypothetical protein